MVSIIEGVRCIESANKSNHEKSWKLRIVVQKNRVLPRGQKKFNLLSSSLKKLVDELFVFSIIIRLNSDAETSDTESSTLSAETSDTGE